MGSVFVQQEETIHVFDANESALNTVIDSRAIPFGISCILVVWQTVYILIHMLQAQVLSKRTHGYNSPDSNASKTSSSERRSTKEHVMDCGGPKLVGFVLARLLGSFFLFVLSWRTAYTTCGEMAFPTCPETQLSATFFYSFAMALLALFSNTWNLMAQRINTLTSLAVLLVYVYRDIWPLALYTEQPEDVIEGPILFIKIGILFATGVVIPLFTPCRYVPVDPENPMPKSTSEQTASIISTLSYSFINEIVFNASKVSHLQVNQLPPLADCDEARYQTTKSFPHVDVFAGAKPNHIFIRLLRVYWKEYCYIVTTIVLYCLGNFVSPIGIYQILKYLETGGADQDIKPWLWIVWLFCGPMLQSLSWQYCIYVSTRVLALMEIVITQLVFEHSLRIRFKAETSANKVEYRQPVTETGSFESASPSLSVDNLLASTTKLDAGVEGDASLNKSLPSTENQEAAGRTTIESQNNRGGNLVGKLNNLVSTDLDNICAARGDFVFWVIGVPLNVVLCLVFLHRLLGWSAFVGFAIMLALLPLPGHVGKSIQKVQQERMKVTDARVQSASETMNVVRMVKLFGWEDKMKEKLSIKREQELRLIWKLYLLNCLSSVIGFAFPTISVVVTYGIYTTVMKKALTPSIVFSSISVFNTLRQQLSKSMKQSVTVLQGKVSLDRLNDFLHHSELLDAYLPHNTGTDALHCSVPVENQWDIGFSNASFSWSLIEKEVDESVTPFDRNFKLRIGGRLFFKRNTINMIIGPTGSGKTSILMALLGEMHFIPTSTESWYNLPREGGIAYAAQESWVQNDTIRNNILFGSEYDEERYQAVIHQCALKQDLDMFSAGDSTEVGERGLTLSGGQKARVTLARAIYSRAEVILLDDVLAALDVHTSAWIADNCFRGDLIKGRTILIVTHNVALVSPLAGFIVSVGMNGNIESYENQAMVAVTRDLELAAGARDERQTAKLGVEVIDQEAVLTGLPQDGKLMVSEEIVEGHITWKSFKLFLASMGGDHAAAFFSVVIATLLLNEWSSTFQVWFVGYWGSQYETHPASEVRVHIYLVGYAAITVVFCLLYATSYMFYMYGAVRASRVIHAKLLDSILGSTFRWLDKTPIGRIIARCTKDVRGLDGPVPQALLWVTESLSGVFAKLGAIILFSPMFFWPGLGITTMGIWLGSMYLKAMLSVKRESSNARAPVLSHFSAAMHGLTSIRAYGAQDMFKTQSLERINYYTRLSRISFNLNRWISVRMDFLGASFTAALAAYLVYGPQVGTSNTGFSLAMALEFTDVILDLVRMYNYFEVETNSVERIQGYLDIEHEPKPSDAGRPPAAWPTSGELRVEGLSARYSPAGPDVLRDVSFHIKSGERVGIVGRTGSGKSSLTLALLRCIITEGEVFFDGVPISTINLDALRANITIIPQMPELLSGTLRENLDPFAQNDDAVLNDALDAAGLFTLQEDAGEARITLDTEIASAGGNLSVGQRQIIALARAMIRRSKLLMLDEATSAIDYKTDAVIQRTLRTQLPKDVTVITVAHRLQSIMDADKIIVLENGRIAEFGKPSELLRRENGKLAGMARESADKDRLWDLAGNADGSARLG